MADIFSKEKRSQVMSSIRAKDTGPELAMRKLLSSELYPKGYRYRLHYKGLPGKPDIVFVSKRVAVFVDGGFWHGYRLKKNGQKLSEEYWLPKIESNIRRDNRVNQRLRRSGWRVVRVWDHDVRKRPRVVLRRVLRALNEKQRPARGGSGK